MEDNKTSTSNYTDPMSRRESFEPHHNGEFYPGTILTLGEVSVELVDDPGDLQLEELRDWVRKVFLLPPSTRLQITYPPNPWQQAAGCTKMVTVSGRAMILYSQEGVTQFFVEIQGEKANERFMRDMIHLHAKISEGDYNI